MIPTKKVGGGCWKQPADPRVHRDPALRPAMVPDLGEHSSCGYTALLDTPKENLLS